MVCTIDMVPEKLWGGKPMPSDVSILLLHKNTVRWSKEFHLRPVNGNTSMMFTDEQARKHPGLRQAHQILVDAIKRPPPMAEWKEKIKSIYGSNALDYKPWEAASKHGKTKQTSKKAPLSTRPTKQVKTGVETLSLPIRTTESLAPAPSTLQASPLIPQTSQVITQASSQPTPLPSSEALLQSSATTTPSIVFDPTSPNGLKGTHPSRYDPTIDTHCPDAGRFPTLEEAQDEEEDANEEKLRDPRDKFMAFWLIGNPIQRFPIPISAVEHREHLVKMRIMWQDEKGDMVVHTPSFAGINPKYFRFVAEFLCTDEDFSVPKPQDVEEDETDMLWNTYAGVWTIAVDLSLEDLLELLVEKVLRLQPWPLSENFTHFVSTVYADDTLPASLDGDIRMRELIAKFIAQHLDDYDGFAVMMKKYPVLERDVSQAKAEMATKESEMVDMSGEGLKMEGIE